MSLVIGQEAKSGGRGNESVEAQSRAEVVEMGGRMAKFMCQLGREGSGV